MHVSIFVCSVTSFISARVNLIRGLRLLTSAMLLTDDASLTRQTYLETCFSYRFETSRSPNRRYNQTKPNTSKLIMERKGPLYFSVKRDRAFFSS